MGTTGLIYVAIVAAWAAYLVPMLLKRNDEVSRRRSAEKYSSSALPLVLAKEGVVVDFALISIALPAVLWAH